MWSFFKKRNKLSNKVNLFVLGELNEKEEESNFRQIFNYPTYNNIQYENEDKKEPIEWEIVEDPDKNEENEHTYNTSNIISNI